MDLISFRAILRVREVKHHRKNYLSWCCLNFGERVVYTIKPVNGSAFSKVSFTIDNLCEVKSASGQAVDTAAAYPSF